MTMQVMIVVLLSILALVSSSCDNSCSGHGTCKENGVCECYEGWGMGLSLDSGDCSQRICPFEHAWVDTPDRLGNHHKYIECSAKGICNRDTGECECFPGYEGKGCARTTCPNDCSGHGQCLYLDKEPFKTVIGDYNNYKKYVTFEERSVSAVGNKFTSSPSFVADLLPNSKVSLDGSIYFVKSVDSSSTFKLGSTVDATTAYSTPVLSSVDVTADGAGLFTTTGVLTDFFLNKEVVIGGVTYYIKTKPAGDLTFTVSQTSGGDAYTVPNLFEAVTVVGDTVTATAPFVATLSIGDAIKIGSTDYWVLTKPTALTFTVTATSTGTTVANPAPTNGNAARKLSASTYIGGVTATTGGVFTGTEAFVANLVIGNPVVINDVTYYVRSKPSTTTFTVATTGPTLYKPATDVATVDAETTRIVTVKVTRTVGTISAANTFVSLLSAGDTIYIDGKIYFVLSPSGTTFTVEETLSAGAVTPTFTGEVEASISKLKTVTGGVTAISATTGVITGLPALVSELVVGNIVEIDAKDFTVRSIDSTTTFTVNTVGTADYLPNPAITPAVVARLISTGTALAPVDARSFVITRGTGSNTLLSSKISHGLVIGDYVYFTGFVGTNTQQTDNNIFNNVVYRVSAITDPYQFAVRKTAGSVTSSTRLVSALFSGTVVTCNVIKIKDIAQGQFDVVDPFIDSITLYIDRKYWDAKKTRACLCDPEYGDVDCSARMCQYGTDVMDSRKDETVTAKNHIQLVSFTGVGASGELTYKPAFMGTSKGKTFALTFRTKLNETFSTIPINMPILEAGSSASVGNALVEIRKFELDVEWALKTLPNSVIDGAKVKVTKPVDTTGVIATNGVYPVTVPLAATNVAASVPGSIGGTTAGSNVFEFSVEFSGNNVQGTQHYLTVEAAKCGDGCFPKIDGLPISSEIGGNTFITVVTKPTFSAGKDNDYESDFNSYECGRRGKCDYKTGQCSCFSGYTGSSCNIITALV